MSNKDHFNPENTFWMRMLPRSLDDKTSTAVYLDPEEGWTYNVGLVADFFDHFLVEIGGKKRRRLEYQLMDEGRSAMARETRTAQELSLGFTPSAALLKNYYRETPIEDEEKTRFDDSDMIFAPSFDLFFKPRSLASARLVVHSAFRQFYLEVGDWTGEALTGIFNGDDTLIESFDVLNALFPSGAKIDYRVSTMAAIAKAVYTVPS